MSAALAYAPVDDGPELVSTSVGDLDADEVVAEAWRRGDLSWKLDPHQERVYAKYREWEKVDPANDNGSSVGQMTRVFVLDVSRRWGKTFLCLTIKTEDCIRYGGIHTYSCAFQKDIVDIVIPLMEEICDDAPEEIRPVFQLSKQGQSMGFYFPHNGAVLRLVGIDMNPRGLRGRASDGFVVSEAGHVRGLRRTIKSVVYPQFQRRPHARLILESNAPEDPEHDFDTVFVPDAQARDAYVFQTIDDNEALDPAEKAEFIRAAGGRGSPECEREYFGKRVRDESTVVVPEFDRGRHVYIPATLPEYADTYLAADPGVSDTLAILWAMWDFERQQLVVQRSWAKSNAGATEVADQIRTSEHELWSDFKAWDEAKGEFRYGSPFMRVSDVDLRLILELQLEHGISLSTTAKDNADAQLAALRTAFSRNKIVILPNSGPLEAQLVAATRKEGGGPMDWKRSEAHGHYDCVAALMYLWRNVVRTRNPSPPEHVLVKGDRFIEPHAERAPKHVAKLGRVLGGGFGRRGRW